MRLETRQLKYFIAVAEELHFGRAAQRLHISQPPLSQQIRQLEDDLGVQLFERTQRMVRLTYAGEVFLAQARAALFKCEEAVDIVRAAARGEAGLLRFGYTAASAYSIIAPLIQAFKARHPRVEVAMQEAVSGDQVRDLAQGRLDVGLVRPLAEWPGLVHELLLEERLIVALPVNHALAQQRSVSLEDLQGQPFIGFGGQGSRYFHDMIDGLLRSAGVAPEIVQRATQPHAVVALVGAGLGLAVVPDAAARVHMDRVVYRPLHADALPQPQLHLCWRADAATPLVRHFLEVAREVAAHGI